MLQVELVCYSADLKIGGLSWIICNHMDPQKEKREAEERISEAGSVSCCWLCRWWVGP